MEMQVSVSPHMTSRVLGFPSFSGKIRCWYLMFVFVYDNNMTLDVYVSSKLW